MRVGLNHVTIVVQDKKVAEDFYFAKLGFEKMKVGTSLWAKVGEQFIHINENSGFVNQKTFAHFAIEIENVQAYLQQLAKKSVEIFDLDESGQEINVNQNFHIKQRCFFTRDPFGNLIEFIDSSNYFFKPQE